jgi:phosphomannomutase/phosphoglucomutase
MQDSIEIQNVGIAISKDIFRAYDIRGIVTSTLTPEVVRDIGRALGTLVIRKGEQQIVIARDGRLSGPALSCALTEGIISTGCHVIDTGMVPTPVLYFATHHLQCPSGVMITGSHNPPEYNGLKIMIGGEALFGEGIQALYKLIDARDFVVGYAPGQCIQNNHIIEDYIQVIVKGISITELAEQKKIKLVIDCGNGVAGLVAPELYKALNCEVIPLYCEVDGLFPNHHPDPGQPENMVDLQKAVKMHQADLGLAFDGDGDRLGVVDNEGHIIWGDRQLIILAKDVLSRHPGAAIIYDVKCTRHLQSQITAWGGKPIMWKTGHSLIKAKMRETGALLAGEMSGHLFFKERWYGFDDALYAGARLLEIVSQNIQHQTVEALFLSIPDSINTPELQMQVSESTKFAIVEKLVNLCHFVKGTINTIDGLRVDFPDGFGLIRASNTTPNLILRFEGDTPLALNRIQENFRQLLLSCDPTWVLPF